MDKIKQRQNRGYLISGIGAIVALLAFLLLPYVTITLNTVTRSTVQAQSQYIAMTVNATTLAQNVGVGVGQDTANVNSSFYPFAAQSQGILWLLPILTVVALAVIGLLVYREHPFGKGITAPVASQRRWANFALIGIAALSMLIQIVIIANLNGQLENYINNISSGSSSSSNLTTVSTVGHVGFWLYLLGMLAVAGGIIFMLVQQNQQAQALSPAASARPWQSPGITNPYAGQYPTYPTGPQPYEAQAPNQAPYQPSQQPYEAQAPTQQSYQPHQPHQPQQPQAYPPQQWPQNPPQSPYPPVQ